MKRGSRFNFRRVYPYTCKGCSKRRGTKIYSRRIVKLCTVCKRSEIDKNQMNLIGGKNEVV